MARVISRIPRSESMNAIEYPTNGEENVSGIKRSLQTWYRKRKSASPSPTRSLHPPTRTAIFSSPVRAHTNPEEKSPWLRQSQQNHKASTVGDTSPVSGGIATNRSSSLQNGPALPPSPRRRSSTRLRRLEEPESFTIAELKRCLELSRNICRVRVGCVSRPYPEPGWRVATRPRSPETCFTTSLPIYSAQHHSPNVTGPLFTIYFECEIRPVNSDDPVCLAVGFVAGRDRACRMPGLERGSIGVHARDGALFLNNKLLESGLRGAFEPGQQLGIGMTFSSRDLDPDQVEGAPTMTPRSSIQVEVFVTRDGRRVATWDLGDQARASLDLHREGFEGRNDIYAAVGTCGEVNVDILFEKRNWMYDPEAEWVS